jgi:hypothetical protein
MHNTGSNPVSFTKHRIFGYLLEQKSLVFGQTFFIFAIIVNFIGLFG